MTLGASLPALPLEVNMSDEQQYDLVTRLREGRTNGTALRWQVFAIHLEAADEIERLTAQLAEARQAERAAVVAWLEGLHWTHANHKPALFFADAIEAGEHLA